MASNLEGPIFRMRSNIQFVIPLMLERDQVPAGAVGLVAGEPPFVSSVCITAVFEAVWSWDLAAGDVEKTELISLLLRTEKKSPPNLRMSLVKTANSSALPDSPAGLFTSALTPCARLGSSRWFLRVKGQAAYFPGDVLTSAGRFSRNRAAAWLVCCESPLWGWTIGLFVTPKRPRLKWCFLNTAEGNICTRRTICGCELLYTSFSTFR